MLQSSVSLLASIRIFESLAEADLHRIAPVVRWTRYPRRTQIIHEGDPTKDVFFVAKGAILAKSYSTRGKEVTYTEIRAGGVFGEFAPIDNDARSASIFTTQPSVIGRMGGDAFTATLLAHPDLHLAITRLVVRKARNLSRRVYEFSTLSVCGRVHAELLRLAKAGAADDAGAAIIDPAPTHQEIASRISSHREAVTRELRYLASIGLLKQRNRVIEIRALDRLRELVEPEVAMAPS